MLDENKSGFGKNGAGTQNNQRQYFGGNSYRILSWSGRNVNINQSWTGTNVES